MLKLRLRDLKSRRVGGAVVFTAAVVVATRGKKAVGVGAEVEVEGVGEETIEEIATGGREAEIVIGEIATGGRGREAEIVTGGRGREAEIVTDTGGRSNDDVRRRVLQKIKLFLYYFVYHLHFCLA